MNEELQAKVEAYTEIMKLGPSQSLLSMIHQLEHEKQKLMDDPQRALDEKIVNQMYGFDEDFY